MSQFSAIYEQICADPANAAWNDRGDRPLYTAAASARILIVGQAPGVRAQQSQVPWDDASGVTLRDWLGLSDEQFYDPNVVALLPMDFYYPGKGTHGDLPPRKSFAAQWHPQLLALMPGIQLTIVIGAYAQQYYLGERMKKNLTETVAHFDDYLPDYFPLVHPSPLNFRWQSKNPWFQRDVVPALRRRVQAVLAAKPSSCH